MATLTIGDVDDDLVAALRVRAARNGRSIEAEARAILHATLTKPNPSVGTGTWIRQHFAGADDLADALPARTEPARAAEIGE